MIAKRSPRDDADRPEFRLQLGWLDALVRHKRWAFAFVGLVYLLCFNGFWRVGVDSALYRGLGHSLAIGRGYTLAGEPHHHAYPGMPLLLALIERIFGTGAFPAVLTVTLMALVTLVFVYRLIALRFPTWIALVVTLGVGLNYRVVRQSQELMSDVPFVLGVVAAFYGLERLRIAAREGPLLRRVNLWPAVTMLVGLGLAAVMRPTFGVLGGAILFASIYRLFINADHRRALHATIVAGVCLVTVGLMVADPRTTGRVPFRGGVYEEELVYGVHNLPAKIWSQLDDLLARDLNDAFYSQDMALKRFHVGTITPFSTTFSIILICGTICVLRRDMAWGLSILGIMALTLPLSTVPRYFIMVMPFLWLGWVLLLVNITLWLPKPLRGATMLLGILFPLGMNLGRTSGLIVEQRAGEMAVFHNKAPDRETGFFQTYRAGLVPHLQRIAAVIAAHVPPEAHVIGPEANVLAYLSDRRVFGERAIFMDRPVKQYPPILEDWHPDYAIFPASEYFDSDSRVRDLINHRVLMKSEPVYRIGKAYLAKVEVRMPRDLDTWRSGKVTATANGAGTQPATQSTGTKKRKTQSAGTTTAPTTRPARKSKHASTTKQSTTQPTTQGVATTQPTKRTNKKPTHAATTNLATTQPSISQPTTGSTTQSATGPTAADRRAARDARDKREARERRERAAAGATTKP